MQRLKQPPPYRKHRGGSIRVQQQAATSRARDSRRCCVRVHVCARVCSRVWIVVLHFVTLFARHRRDPTRSTLRSMSYLLSDVAARADLLSSRLSLLRVATSSAREILRALPQKKRPALGTEAIRYTEPRESNLSCRVRGRSAVPVRRKLNRGYAYSDRLLRSSHSMTKYLRRGGGDDDRVRERRNKE